MIGFALHTVESAPPAAKPLLHQLQQIFGFVPNLFAKLAESDTALAAYLEIRARFEHSSLNPIEQQVVCLAVSVENNSPFCVSAHTLAARNVHMDEMDLAALRERGELPTPKLNALAEFTRDLVRARGAVDDGDINVMLAAGYTPRQLVDIVMGVSLKTFSNYASHLVHSPLNSEFVRDSWIPRNEHPGDGTLFSAAGRDPDRTLRNRRPH